MNAAVAISVGDEQLADRGDRTAGRHVEWLAIERWACRPRAAERAELSAVRCVLRDRVHTRIGDPHMTGGIDGHAVHEAGKLAFTPRTDEASLGIEHHHRM